ncbi:MAG: response regulator transcription factor [Armatimonadetes bacterium]|nr:response regulator transcription factor [Armatimonadota bacterium]
MSKSRVLVVDDEENVCQLVSLYLEKEGFEVDIAYNGREALEKVREQQPDLVVLDLMLPEVDGLEVCREIRKSLNIPIIMLTAKTEEIDRILGLEMGADDYMTKPFSPRELVARVKAVLRRASFVPASGEQVINYPGLNINIASREVKVNGEKVTLTPKEFDLLWHFATNRDKVFTREKLLEQVWDYERFYGDERTVDQHIKRLRRKIDFPKAPFRIATIWGVGYKFEVSE